MTTQFQVTASATADLRTRSIRGLVVPFGEVGNTSAGPTRFHANSIRVPGDVRRVKLLNQHTTDAPAVGVGDGFAIAANGIGMSFTIPPGPEGDDALRLAQSGQRDGLSVGVAVHASHVDADGVVNVTDAELTEVSLVTIPAFASAQVLEIAANRKGNTMSEPSTAAPEAAPAAPEAPAAVTASTAVDLIAAAPTPPPPALLTPARAIIPPGAGAAAPMTLQAAASTAVSYLRGGNPPEMLSAALADQVPADDVGNGIVNRPQWVGELWQHSRSARPIIESIRRATLTGLTVQGFVFDPENRANVLAYAGNKTAVPSNKIKTLAVTANAKRYAYGLDVDRAYIDLGSSGFIEDVFAQCVDSYRNITEADVAAAIIAAATALTATDLIEWVQEASAEAVALGTSLDFVVVASDVFATFAGLKAADVPWWLHNGDGGVNLPAQTGSTSGLRFAVDPTLPAGSIVGGDSRAATYYEVNPPIRVTAQNIPLGGVDIGFFGYGALIINDAAALFKNGATVPLAAKGK